MDLLFGALILTDQTALFRATQAERVVPRRMGVAMGMAALTKGPLGVALPLAGFALFLLRQRRGWLLVSCEAGLAVAVVLALAFGYLAGVVAVEGWGFVRSVAVDQIWVRVVRSVDLSEPVYAYVPMLAAALLPWSVVLAWLIWRGVSQLGWRGLFAPSRGQPLRCPICGPAFLAVWR